MDRESRIFVAGGTGMVSTAIIGKLGFAGFKNIIANCHHRRPATGTMSSGAEWFQADLTRREETESFFGNRKPEYVFLAAAKVRGWPTANIRPTSYTRTS